MRTLLAAVAASLLLVACATFPETSEEMIRSPGFQEIFFVPGTLDASYKKLSEQMSACAARFGGRYRAISSRSSESAQISFLGSTVAGGNHVFVVLVLDSDQDAVRVTSYSVRRGLPTIPRETLQAWISGDVSSCF